MLDLQEEWCISFAGCGFMGIYYVGASSCILERFPRFIHGASKIYGASAGALLATILTVGIPLEKCCVDLMFMAKEARRRKLGCLHPAYNLLQIVQDSLLRNLPEDAHVRASGRLCVSLTRVRDGKNVLVSQFDSREELIEALICSCFVPLYCGVIPPTYRGVHYVDGAVSDNLPRCHQRNTITFSAYAGESDVCPPAGTLNFHEVRFNNVSIQVNSENMYRVTRTFFPPKPEAMAEICHNGYMDALRFLQENNLISSECPQRSLQLDAARGSCCEPEEVEEEEKTQQDGQEPAHGWLNPRLIENLPVSIKKVLCEACRETHASGGLLSHVTNYLPKKVTSYLQIPAALPVQSARSLAHRFADWIPDVPRDLSWLYGVAGDIYRQAWKGEEEDGGSEMPLRRCTSLPEDLNLWRSEAAHISSLSFTGKTHSVLDHMPLTPPPTPTLSPTSGCGDTATGSPGGAGGGWALGRAVGWIRNLASEKTSNLKTADDGSASFSAFK